MGSSATESSRKYKEKTYARFELQLKKEVKEQWKEESTKRGYTSLTAFIVDCVNHTLEDV